jgi:tetratricopeptide (TPR) repeat protein
MAPARTRKVERGNRSGSRWTGLLVLCVLGGAVYWNTLDSPFILDDAPNIEENPHIQLSRISLGGLWSAGFDSPSSSRPVSNVSFALNYYFGKRDVTGYHIVNIAIHLITGILVYLVARITLQLLATTRGHPGIRERDKEIIAFFAALLFIAHPLQTQAVTYVVQRMTSMAAMFYLLSLLLFLHGRIRRGGARGALWALALASWLLALGSKQIAATLPVILFLYEFTFFQDLDRGWLRRNLRIPAAVAVVSAIAVIAYLEGDPSRILGSYASRDFTMGERVLTQLRVVFFYLGLAFLPLPSRLNLLHEFSTSHSLVDPLTTLASLVGLVALLALALLLAKRWRLASFCILWFLIHLAIESSIIGLEMVFEHRLYLPMVGVSLLASYGLFRAFGERRASAVAVAATLVLCLGAGTALRNRTWGDRVSFWSDVVAKNPRSPRAHNSLGRAFEQEQRLEEAVAEFREALRLAPDHTEAHYNLGTTAYSLGRIDEAIRHYEDALRTNPDYAKAHNNLAAALVREGRFDEAIRHLSETLRIDPYHANAHFNLAVLLEKKGRAAEAMSHYSAVLRIDPDDAEARRRLAALTRRTTSGAAAP